MKLIDNLLDSVRNLSSQWNGNLDATRTTTETHPVPDSIEVENLNGDVTVRGCAREDVELTFTKRGRTSKDLDDIRVHTQQTGDRLSVTVNHPDDTSGAVDIEMSVPDGLSLSEIRTKNGAITARNVGGHPEFETVNGSITVSGCTGYVDVRSTNGSVDVEDVAGVDHAESVNGSQSLEVRSLRRDTTISTTTGSIEVRVGAIDATVSVKTNVGSVDVPIFDDHSKAIGLTRLSETLGSGDHDLRIKNEIGTVAVRRLNEPTGEEPTL